MNIQCLFVTGRAASVALMDGGLYETLRPYRLTLNGKPWGETGRVVTSLYGLWPATAYELCAWDGDACEARLSFTTLAESVTLDVRRMGALGDGMHDDTPALQAAIACCPPGGRVLIPRGEYAVGPLFLKSHVRVEFQKGAALRLWTERSRFPILPGLTLATDEASEYDLGAWEGNPLDMYAALLNGVEVEDVHLYGPGLADGCAQLGDWWQNPKVRRGAWRGRLLFLCRCRDVTVMGLSFANSPSWNLHPYFSQNLRFLDLFVTAPADSPNTDGFDPESCQGVLAAGCRFSLGDDCVAIKSGKLYMGCARQTPCENVEIMHCLMENGHGGVTIGSEMAGGVKDVRVHHCLMRRTDRGLRIKTRRGRGKWGVVDDIVFEDVKMERVSAPLVVNEMYFCDPDGHTPYVQSRDAQPVDERTPRVGRIAFSRVTALGCGACAGYLLGLPEKKIERVELSDVRFSFAPDARPMAPAMADGVEPCARQGLMALNVAHLALNNVVFEGQDGEELTAVNVDDLRRQ